MKSLAIKRGIFFAGYVSKRYAEHMNHWFVIYQYGDTGDSCKYHKFQAIMETVLQFCQQTRLHKEILRMQRSTKLECFKMWKTKQININQDSSLSFKRTRLQWLSTYLNRKEIFKRQPQCKLFSEKYRNDPQKSPNESPELVPEIDRVPAEKPFRKMGHLIWCTLYTTRQMFVKISSI